MLKLGRVTKVKVLFLVLVYVLNIDLFEFSAAILEKGLFTLSTQSIKPNYRDVYNLSATMLLVNFEDFQHCAFSLDFHLRKFSFTIECKCLVIISLQNKLSNFIWLVQNFTFSAFQQAPLSFHSSIRKV